MAQQSWRRSILLLLEIEVDTVHVGYTAEIQTQKLTYSLDSAISFSHSLAAQFILKERQSD